jgi:DNA-binding NtrC family response regulator
MTTSAAPVYVVDDDPSVRESLRRLIRSAGWPVETFGSAREFLASPWSGQPSCLVLDVDLPDLSGLELQQRLASADSKFSIIFLTGHGDIPMTVRAMKAGALEFLTKPPPEEQLLAAIRLGLARSSSPRTPPGGIHRAQGVADRIIGQSRALRSVLEQVEAVARTAATVLILGETGTGKESVARAIHARSSRCSGPFISVNCAAIPESLVASDLFGHEKGAFTGALQRRVGRFEQAQRGTIFLDEIGELPAETQVALLRVLQEREFERVGGHQPIAADVRVIAATNRDLPAAIAAGAFRSDLFYRLNVFPIEMPPLRARKEDISLLVEYFMTRIEGPGRRLRSVSPRAIELLHAHSWPGNIRELQNVVERALIISTGAELTVDPRWLSDDTTTATLPPSEPHLGPAREASGSTEASSRSADAGPTDEGSLAQLERQTIVRTLAALGGNRRLAAAKLGIGLRTLYTKLKQYEIN